MINMLYLSIALQLTKKLYRFTFKDISPYSAVPNPLDILSR